MRHLTRLTTALLVVTAAGCGSEWTDDGTEIETELDEAERARATSQLAPGTGPTVTSVASGAGWRRLAVTGTMLDVETGASRTISGEEVYLVKGPVGIAAVPLPQTVRDELSADLQARLGAGELPSADEALYFLHAKTALAVASGTLAKSAAPGTTKLSCGDSYRNLDKTLSFEEPVTHSSTFSSPFAGTLALAGTVKGMATGRLRVKIHRAWCVPYWVSFVHLKVSGDVQARGRVTASGSFARDWTWNQTIAKLPLGKVPFTIGPIAIPVGLNLPVELGLDASAKLTANLDGKVTASGSFDMTCTTSGCSGNKTTSHDFDALATPTVSLTGRAKVKPWIQAAVRLYVYDDTTIFGQVGVRPAIEGDLWGYAGNTCGDANHDGVNEQVSALTLDADVAVDLTARVLVDIPIVPKVDRRWSWNLGRWHVGFWGSGSALAPIFYRKLPEAGEIYIPGVSCSGVTFQGRMRPCWPYADKVSYHLDWKDGTASDFTLTPATLFSACKSFSFPQPASVTLTAIKDAHARSLNRTVTAATGPLGQPTAPDPLPPAP